jgi:hypothetical protein
MLTRERERGEMNECVVVKVCIHEMNAKMAGIEVT